ncbi:MAG: tripartite tricarboxylate transporter permease [Gammaproteobacteria bacterium]|nr:tripartite tricarboxylate transporter permease [Gammaproteobacteria bacterium]
MKETERHDAAAHSASNNLWTQRQRGDLLFALSLCLLLLSPYLANIAPFFGSRDIFMAALLGVVLVILAHRGQTVAAAMLVSFGMFLNVVGLETVRYSKRFTFGMEWLNSGIDLITVILGLFAISQAFQLLLDADSQPQLPKISGGKLAGFLEVFRNKRVAGVASGFGVIMGMIPGVPLLVAGARHAVSITPH